MSKQDYITPPELIRAVERRFGPLAWDLAANAETHRCERFFSPEQDGLAQDWRLCGDGWLWLNPPFKRVVRWEQKCAAEMRRGARILNLTLASVGAAWFRDHVAPNAHVIELYPRVPFVGMGQGFNKDLILNVFAHGLTGRSAWNWKEASE
jgi:phage N-6-adenine-methyltransferase